LSGADFEARKMGIELYAFVAVATVMNIDRPARLNFVITSIIENKISNARLTSLLNRRAAFTKIRIGCGFSDF
jgi:hypothetical protein